MKKDTIDWERQVPANTSGTILPQGKGGSSRAGFSGERLISGFMVFYTGPIRYQADADRYQSSFLK